MKMLRIVLRRLFIFHYEEKEFYVIYRVALKIWHETVCTFTAVETCDARHQELKPTTRRIEYHCLFSAAVTVAITVAL